jgi:ornithine decarboxylase
MFGLAKRRIAVPRTEEEEAEARKVVRFSRPKGKAGVRKQRRR